MQRHFILIGIILLVGCEENVESSCTEVMFNVQGAGLTYELNVINDSCVYTTQPYVSSVTVVFDNIDTEKPNGYYQLINDTLYSYSRWTNEDTDSSWYNRSGYSINDDDNKYYFILSNDTLYKYWKGYWRSGSEFVEGDSCASKSRLNYEVRYTEDSLAWCSPVLDESPIYDTLYYKCSDYPTIYVPDCWNIDNPWSK